VPLLAGGLVSSRILDRRRGLFGFVGQAALLLGDARQFLRVLFKRVDPAALVNHLLAFVEQAFQIHPRSSLGGTRRTQL
jgi:hypothetical protein